MIAAGRLDEVVPIEPASDGRTARIVQWDKDDCADLGIIKIDLLGLGMLAALEETIPLIREHEGVDDRPRPAARPTIPTTYAMIRRADTVGVFQIESRAQMATLPRLKPRTLLRPGGRDRDHPPRPDRRADGAPLPEPPRGPRAGHLSRTRRSSRS